jgi:TonB family protein
MKTPPFLITLLLASGCASNPAGTKDSASNGVEIRDESSNEKTSPSGVRLRVVKKVAPDYPPAARKARLQGLVQVQLTIQPDGSVSDLFVVRSAHPVLDQLVLDALAQWKYEPYTPVNGKLEKLQLPMIFELP